MKYQALGFEDAMRLGYKEEDLTEWGDFDCRSGVFEMAGEVPIRMLGCDGGEPEDQLLYRDWSWVVPALNAAHKENPDGQ